ncbi:uncharacterized protein LOC130794192 isoform X3 [Actinidia eriantha]|uniref:uncharacterized protein LOC130794192 isoform X3 n=1 Tax=Actinidia eriantha TaxID=165200 RepID=UPI002590E38A|nr:uncharacterized protein LOC130794192 isoform X3 [Actinidia eriantha]
MCSCCSEDDVTLELNFEEMQCTFTGYTLLYLSRPLIYFCYVMHMSIQCLKEIYWDFARPANYDSLRHSQVKLMERETLCLFQRWALSALLLVGRIFIELVDHKSCTTICSHLYNRLEAKFLNPNKVGIGFTAFYFWVSTVKYR